ncbi:MAG: pilus assembly protein TadG-related protein [Hyphomicrobium sp.]
MSGATTIKRSFASDESGAIAILFGLMFIALTFIAGVAIDYGRIRHIESKFAAAVDAAALAGGRALLNGSTETEAEAVALQYFLSNVGTAEEHHVTFQTPDIDVDTATGGVSISVTPVVPMTLTSVMGFNTVDVPVYASTRFEQKDIELSMQLDLTGSMCDPCSKIVALKDATLNLIDILLPDAGTPNKVRIALAPYASGVNVGSYAADVTDGRNGSTSCAYDRSGPNADTDAAPGTGDFFKGKLDLPSANNCPAHKIVPLTAEKQTLIDTVTAFTTSTTTAGQLGTNWAWNLISPNWGTIWPSDSKPVAYNDSKTLKAVILMTDGEYNTFEGRCDSSGCNPYGTRGKKSNAHAKDMCANMKAQGIVVYTVGFKVTHPAAVDTLSTCASSVDHYFLAESDGALKAAFQNIANQLNNLRLTN